MKLATKINFTMLVVALVPLTTAMTLALLHSNSQVKSLTIKAAQSQVRAGGESLSGYFSTRLGEVVTYANMPLVQTMDWGKIGPYMQGEFQRHSGTYEKFVLADTNSNYYSTATGNPAYGGLTSYDDTDPNARLKSLKIRPYWQELVGTNIDKKTLTHVSEPMVSLTTGARQVMIGASILSKQNEVIGMLGGAIEWKEIESRINFILNNIMTKTSKAGNMFLLAADGTYIYHTNPEKAIHVLLDDNNQPVINKMGDRVVIKNRIVDETGKELASVGKMMIAGLSGTGFYIAPETGQEMAIIYSPVASANYSIAMALPKSFIMAPAINLRSLLIAIMGGAIILIVVASITLGFRIATPVTELCAAAKAIAKGDRLKVPIRSINDEMDQLIAAFNYMVSSLKSREDIIRRSESRFRGLVETTSDWIWEVDLDGIYTYSSPQVKDLIGFEPEEVLGKSAFSFMTKEDADRLRVEFVLLAAEYKAIKSLVNTLVHKDGSLVHMETSAAPAYDIHGNFCGYRGIDRDITTRVIAEKERERLLDSLAEKNADLSNIVDVASHDLRSPIVNIDGFSSELEFSCEKLARTFASLKMDPVTSKEILKILHEDIPLALGFIHSSAAKMDLLMKALVKLSKLGKAAVEIKKINVNVIVSEIKRSLQFQINECGVEITIEKLPSCCGDQSQITQVFTNLIDNAIKYLSPARKGKINISGCEDDKWSTYSIYDNGLGIEKAHQPKVFELFHRLDPSNSVDGEGVGLTLVKRIMDKHQGKIWLESTPGIGTTFYITLPKVICES